MVRFLRAERGNGAGLIGMAGGRAGRWESFRLGKGRGGNSVGVEGDRSSHFLK